MTRKDVKGDQPSGGETTWTNTGATRYGRGQHKTGSFGDDMLRPSPNHGTQRLPYDDDESALTRYLSILFLNILTLLACTHSVDNSFHTLMVLWENENFLTSNLLCFFNSVKLCPLVILLSLISKQN